MWLIAACASALFAGVTAVLAKCGIRHTDSDVATAVRTVVVLLFSWIMVLVVGSLPTAAAISAVNVALFFSLNLKFIFSLLRGFPTPQCVQLFL